jgi:hypothetical protein
MTANLLTPRKDEEQQEPTDWRDLVYFPELVAQLAELDETLSQLRRALSDQTIDPGFVIEDIDDLTGEGFHRCQRYMRRRIGPNPWAPERDRRFPGALHCGPVLGERHLAEAIWAGANYWKHDGEWPLDERRLSDRQRPTLRLFRDLGVLSNDYMLFNLLQVLSGRLALSPLADQLVLWRNAFDREVDSPSKQQRRKRRRRPRRATS